MRNLFGSIGCMLLLLNLLALYLFWLFAGSSPRGTEIRMYHIYSAVPVTCWSYSTTNSYNCQCVSSSSGSSTIANDFTGICLASTVVPIMDISDRDSYTCDSVVCQCSYQRLRRLDSNTIHLICFQSSIHDIVQYLSGLFHNGVSLLGFGR